MKRKEFLKDIATKGEKELKKDLSELRDKLWDLNSQFVAGKTKNFQEISLVKKNIARIFTKLNAPIKK